MGLNISSLKNVSNGPSGGIRAGCPACAAKGEDRQEQHLYIYPDGRFGCAKYPKDKSHRSAIAKIVGLRDNSGKSNFIPIRAFKVKKHTLKGIFGTDGTPFYNLRALLKNNTTNNSNNNTACAKDFEKAVPFVPELDKSLSINISDVNGVVTPEMWDEIRSWGWLWDGLEGWDARLVGAVWDGVQYGEKAGYL